MDHRVKPWPQRFWDKVDKSPGQGPWGTCWGWTASLDTSGYGQIRDPDGRLRRATHISWEETYGEPPPSNYLCHTCDYRPCTNPEHLFDGNNLINTADMVAKGRVATGDRHSSRLHPECRPRGEKHPEAKLTEADVLEIRRIYANPGQGVKRSLTSQRALAKRFGVCRNVIVQILKKTIWAHIP